jgi:hypothetical protein
VKFGHAALPEAAHGPSAHCTLTIPDAMNTAQHLQRAHARLVVLDSATQRRARLPCPTAIRRRRLLAGLPGEPSDSTRPIAIGVRLCGLARRSQTVPASSGRCELLALRCPLWVPAPSGPSLMATRSWLPSTCTLRRSESTHCLREPQRCHDSRDGISQVTSESRLVLGGAALCKPPWSATCTPRDRAPSVGSSPSKEDISTTTPVTSRQLSWTTTTC